MCTGDTCSICMDSMRGVPTNGVSMRFWALKKRTGKVDYKTQCERLKCGHVFHFKCISKWFLTVDNESSGNCPMCRSKIKFSNKYGIFNRKMYIKKDWISETHDYEWSDGETMPEVEENEDGSESSSSADWDDVEEDWSDDESNSDEEWIDQLMQRYDGETRAGVPHTSGAVDMTTFSQQIASRAEEISRQRQRHDAEVLALDAEADMGHDWFNYVGAEDSEFESDDFQQGLGHNTPYHYNYYMESEGVWRVGAPRVSRYYCEFYDISYNSFNCAVLMLPKYIFLQQKQIDGFYDTEPCRPKKGFQNSKQGQDFGCAKA